MVLLLLFCIRKYICIIIVLFIIIIICGVFYERCCVLFCFWSEGAPGSLNFVLFIFLLLLFFVQITKSKQTTRRHEAEDTGVDYTLQLLLLSQAIHPCHPSIHLLVRRLSDDERRATEHCSLMVRFHKHFKPVAETRVVVKKN